MIVIYFILCMMVALSKEASFKLIKSSPNSRLG